jgi:hypothetical protein
MGEDLDLALIDFSGNVVGLWSSSIVDESRRERMKEAKFEFVPATIQLKEQYYSRMKDSEQ